MNHNSILLVAAALLSFGDTVECQSRPNFSGTWVAMKETPSGAAAARTAILGQRVVIRHEPGTLTIVRVMGEDSTATDYALDGSEVRRRVAGSLCMADSEVVETAAWTTGDGIALSVVGSIAAGSSTVSRRNVSHTLRLAAADTLVVEAATHANSPVGTLYKRSSEALTNAATPDAPVVPGTMAQLSWLSGEWVGPTGSEERWTPAVSGSMFAVSRTLRDNALIEFEFLCIVQRRGGLVYQAMPNGRSPATDFRMTRIDANTVTFENPAHDFPKMIRYSLTARDTLEATVSGAPGDRARTFSFKRRSP